MVKKCENRGLSEIVLSLSETLFTFIALIKFDSYLGQLYEGKAKARNLLMIFINRTVEVTCLKRDTYYKQNFHF